MKTHGKSIKKGKMVLRDVQWEEDDWEMTMSFEVQWIVTQIMVNYA